MRFLITLVLLTASYLPAFAAQPEQWTGTIDNVSRAADGTGTIRLKWVTGPVPGRYSQVRVTVPLCVNGVCPTVDPSLLILRNRVVVTAERANDFLLIRTTSIVAAEVGSDRAIVENFGEIIEMLPPAGGWQWIKVRNPNRTINLQVCAEYSVRAICPVMTGGPLQVGQNIVHWGEVKLNDTDYWKTEAVSVIRNPNLVFSPPGQIYFGPLGVGQSREIVIQIVNIGTGPATNLTFYPEPSPDGAWNFNTDCENFLAPGQSCRATLVFTPRVIGRSYFRAQVRYSGFSSISGKTEMIEAVGEGIELILPQPLAK